MKTMEPRITQIRADYKSEKKDPETHAVIAAAMEVHRESGPGFLEAGYHKAMSRELMLRSVPFKSRSFLAGAAIQLSFKVAGVQAIRIEFFCVNLRNLRFQEVLC